MRLLIPLSVVLLWIAAVEDTSAWTPPPLPPLQRKLASTTTTTTTTTPRRQGQGPAQPQLSREQRIAFATRLAAARAGTFFNPIPPSNDDDDDDDEKMKKKNDDSMSMSGNTASIDNNNSGSASSSLQEMDDKDIETLLQRRAKPSRASQPSTINGIPTKEASKRGFGRTSSTTTTSSSSAAAFSITRLQEPQKSKPYWGIGPSDAAVNDITNPEVDDQGYTLYQNAVTGEKSRVFEALVSYPCEFTMKIVGRNTGSFVQEMIQTVADSCQVDPDNIAHSVRALGKWTSVTVQAPVQSAEMLYALYERVDKDPRVKFKF